MLKRILDFFGEQRATDYDPRFAPDAWGRGFMPATYPTSAAVLSNIAVAARCVSLRSELLASVPLKLYRRLPNGDRERVTDHPLSLVLGDLANPLMTSFELREFIVRSLDLHGNAYARIERNGRGQVTALWPWHPLAVQVQQLESGRLRYRYTQSGQRGPIVLLQEEVLHVRASSDDGLLGRSPITICRASLGVTIAQNETAGDLARSGYDVKGYIMQPGKVGPKTRGEKERQANNESGRAGKVVALDEGARFVPAAFSGQDAELLASRQLSNQDTSHVFGVPPAVLGLNDTVSYGSAAEANRALIQHAIQPLAERVEQALMRCLLTADGRRQFFIEHDLNGLLRGSFKERFEGYRTAREIGVYSANDIRRIENENAIDGGDEYMRPVTLAGSSAPNDGGAIG